MSISFKILQDNSGAFHLAVYDGSQLVKFFCGLSRYCVNDAMKAIKKDGVNCELDNKDFPYKRYYESDIYVLENESQFSHDADGVYILKSGEIVGLVRGNFHLWDDLSIMYKKHDLKYLDRVSNKI